MYYIAHWGFFLHRFHCSRARRVFRDYSLLTPFSFVWLGRVFRLKWVLFVSFVLWIILGKKVSLYEKIIVLTTKPVVIVAVYLYILTCFWILNKTSICVNEILDFFFFCKLHWFKRIYCWTIGGFGIFWVKNLMFDSFLSIQKI